MPDEEDYIRMRHAARCPAGGRVTCLSADYALGHQAPMIASGGFQQVRLYQGGGGPKVAGQTVLKMRTKGGL